MMRRLTIILSILVTMFFVQDSAHAQSVTKKTFKALEEIQKLVEADQHRQAQQLLESLVEQVRGLPYDNAIANQYLAHTSIMLDQPKRARRALESALNTTELPPELRTELNLFYGTVLLGEEEFDVALPVLEEWLAAETSPKANQIFSVAYANYKTGNLNRSETLMVRAFNATPTPADSWYQLYYRVLFEQKKYRRAEGLLHEMLTRQPGDKQLWRLLANHHLQLEKSGDALAAVMISYINELVTDEDELRQIVSMFSYIDIPDKGARLLQQWVDEGRVEGDVETIRLIGNLWLMARERDSAKVVLKKSAGLAPDGETYELLAGIYFEDEDWSEAYSAYQNALRLGNLEEPYRVHLLAGISAFRAGRDDDARQSLKSAAASRKFRKQAEGIIKMLDRQKQKQKFSIDRN